MVLLLSDWAQDPGSIAVAFSSLGFLLHLNLIPFEIDESTPLLASAFVLFWIGLATIFVRFLELSVFSAILNTFLAVSSFTGALATSMTMYRVFFHRLRDFHGPLGAKISRFFVMSDISKSGLRYHVELEKMHQKYGDFVRVAMADYMPRVEAKADEFIKGLRERTGKIIDITQWSLFYTFDVMGLIAFSKDYGQLNNGKEHFAITGMHDQMELVGVFSAVPWLMHLLQSIPGIKGSFEIFLKYCNQQVDERKAEWKQDEERKPNDVVSWLIKSMEDGGPSAPGPVALYEDGRLTIVAGSDTTGATLANAFYFLTTHPEVYQRLQKEVDQVKASGGDASQIPYLDAIITETLRLKPVVPSGLKRLTPPEGLVVDEVWIPGRTIVITPQHVLQRDERNFERPLEFLPERWLEEGKHMHKDERAWFPFSIGLYSCVGKHLGLMQLRFALHRVATEFDVSFAPQEDGRKFFEDAKDTFTMTCPSLQLVLNKRQLAQS
ncbi:hypothetical protein N7478_004566 [Penicillium angulare]|uniref:uncharacterized protein n=1 Tax=Penicillium angulare TaxID=116970 RepID=UPI002541553B|nr:uncharacterized protein N7478_004566 [Penicillium angulare]KAJ5279194.1 hypothetical protein N7478_004566 [Penicillium angulare]